MNELAKFWISKLKLDKHPEGGYYANTYRSDRNVNLSGYTDHRSICTVIYYLLTGKQFASFHIMKSDEIWHYYSGSSLTLHMIDPKGNLKKSVLGPNFNTGEQFQVTVKSDC